MARRLFLFAAYDAQGIVRDTLVYYVSALSRCGDVVLVMDSDAADGELLKLADCTLHASAVRHGEYDFGSYKRAWVWATENLGMAEYDFVYMVNDSVIGPLFDIEPVLRRMEEMQKDAFALAYNPYKKGPHMQSWFLGMRRKVFASEQFDGFIRSVSREASKREVCIRYERGFTRLAKDMGADFGGLYTLRSRKIYTDVRKLFRKGMPFFKKSAFLRHNGALGDEVKYVLEHTDPLLARAVRDEIVTVYGLPKLLTGNRLEIIRRYTLYALGKLLGRRDRM